MLALIAALSASIGESFLSFGMKRIGESEWVGPWGWFRWLIAVISTPYIIIGVVFLACFFFLYLITLSHADLSYVLPITAASIVFAAILARIFLKERISAIRLAGIAVIILGIIIISMDRSVLTSRPTDDSMREIRSE